jgi:zinc protease
LLKPLLLQMQLLAAYATDPAYRGNGLDRLKDSAETDLKSFSSSSSRVLSREASGLVHSGDRRWVFPTLAQLKAISMADISGTIGPALANAPLEISVVGDTTEDEVIKAVAATFGALPQRLDEAKEPAGARDVRFPKTGGHFEFTHEGAQDQATAYVAWPASDFYANRRQSRTLSLLKEMIEIRMTDEFREAQGATYSPSADTTFSTAFKGYGFLEAQAETKPELLDGFYKTLDKVVDEMRSGSFSNDVIDRARTPLVKTLEKSRLGNGFWEGFLSDIQSDPRGIDTVRTQISDYTGITREELVAAAKAFLGPAHRLEIRVVPRKPQALNQPRICPFASIETASIQPKVVIPCRKAA